MPSHVRHHDAHCCACCDDSMEDTTIADASDFAPSY